MAQPPAYYRKKDFTEDFGNETDHSALNAELDKASNSINDIRTNLAILQADDGKLRPSVVTADSISYELRVSLVEGVVMDAQAMLDQSLAAAEASARAKEGAETSAKSIRELEITSARSAEEAAASAKMAADTAGEVPAIKVDISDLRASISDLGDDLVRTAEDCRNPIARATGTADKIAGDCVPKIKAMTDGLLVWIRASAANQTVAPSFQVVGYDPKPIVKGNNLPLMAGDIAGAGHWLELQYDEALDKWVLQNPYNPITRTSNGYGTRRISTSAPTITDGQDGDIWYRI